MAGGLFLFVFPSEVLVFVLIALAPKLAFEPAFYRNYATRGMTRIRPATDSSHVVNTGRRSMKFEGQN